MNDLVKAVAEEAWGVDLDDPTLMASDKAQLTDSARTIIRLVRGKA